MTNPMGWPAYSLSSLVSRPPNNGIFKKNDEYGEGLPVIWVEELYRDLVLDVSESRLLPATQSEIEKYGLLDGDILFCRSSLKRDGIGFNSMYRGPDLAALFECHLIRISPDKGRVISEFLNFQLRLPSMRSMIIANSNTVTMSTIGQGKLCELVVIVPPLEYQQRFEVISSQLLSYRNKMLESKLLSNCNFESLKYNWFGERSLLSTS